MKFSLLLEYITLIIRINVMLKKDIRDMISMRNTTYVITTKDGLRGRRFIFRNGKFSSDRNLKEYDMAYVWKDAETAYRVFTAPDPLGWDKAQANWELEHKGDVSLHTWFTFFLGYATGAMKRKSV